LGSLLRQGLPVPQDPIEPIKAAPRNREDTKQAQIIAMLER